MQRRCRANGKWEDMGFQARDSRPDRTETEPCLVLLSRAEGLLPRRYRYRERYL